MQQYVFLIYQKYAKKCHNKIHLNAIVTDIASTPVILLTDALSEIQLGQGFTNVAITQSIITYDLLQQRRCEFLFVMLKIY